MKPKKMKPKKIARLIAEVLREDRIGPEPTVTLRTLGVNFDERSIIFDGRMQRFETVGVDIPILSGSAVFITPRNAERIG